ncbi:hypothetical protein BGZ81_004932, partial [Podila clonocystis]
TFCDERYEGDCSVDAARILEYFTSVIFKQTVKKYIHQEAGYSGVVGQAGESSKSVHTLEEATTSHTRSEQEPASTEGHNQDSSDSEDDEEEEVEQDTRAHIVTVAKKIQ